MGSVIHQVACGWTCSWAVKDKQNLVQIQSLEVQPGPMVPCTSFKFSYFHNLAGNCNRWASMMNFVKGLGHLRPTLQCIYSGVFFYLAIISCLQQLMIVGFFHSFLQSWSICISVWALKWCLSLVSNVYYHTSHQFWVTWKYAKSPLGVFLMFSDNIKFPAKRDILIVIDE